MLPIFFTIMSLISSISPCTLAMLSWFTVGSEYRFCVKYKLRFSKYTGILVKRCRKSTKIVQVYSSTSTALLIQSILCQYSSRRG